MIITGFVPDCKVGIWWVIDATDTHAEKHKQIYVDSSGDINELNLPLVGPYMDQLSQEDIQKNEWVMIRCRKKFYLPYQAVVHYTQQELEITMVKDDVCLSQPAGWWGRFFCRHNWGDWSEVKTYEYSGFFGIKSMMDVQWRWCKKCHKSQNRRGRTIREIK